jgi:hypothetical protein
MATGSQQKEGHSKVLRRLMIVQRMLEGARMEHQLCDILDCAAVSRSPVKAEFANPIGRSMPQMLLS